MSQLQSNKLEQLKAQKITQSTQISSLPLPRWSSDTGSEGDSTFLLGAPGKADQIPNPQKQESFCFLQQAAATQSCNIFGAAASDPSRGALLPPGHPQQLSSCSWYQQDELPQECCDTAQDRGSGLWHPLIPPSGLLPEKLPRIRGSFRLEKISKAIMSHL